MSRRAQSTPLRALRALGLLLPAAAVGYWLSTRSEPVPSRFEDALDRALEPIVVSRELGAKWGTGSSTQLRLVARQAAQTSIQYLAPRDLELWQDLRLQVAKSSPGACARLWQGGATDFFGPAVAALGDEPLRQYTEMLARGLALRLERKPPPEPSPGALENGLRAIGGALPEAERPRFEADLRRRDLPDARACELFLGVSAGTHALDPNLRTDFLRALAKGLLLGGG